MKIGFIGAGRWATPYALAAKNIGLEISGIYSPDNSAEDLAKKVGTSASADADTVISGADCILIGSPTPTHAKYVEMVANAGKSALCANPAAANAADLDIIEGLARGNANLYANLYTRHRPEYLRLKSAIASGDLGTLGILRLGICLPAPDGWRADAEKSGGALLETGVHLIDALEWLAGPIQRIYGASPDSALEFGLFVARLQDGSIAHLEISWAEADGVSFDYYEVAGSSGLLEYDSRTAPLMRVETRQPAESAIQRPGASIAEHELLALVAALEGNKTDFPTLEHGVKVARRALQIKEAVAAEQVAQLV